MIGALPIGVGAICNASRSRRSARSRCLERSVGHIGLHPVRRPREGSGYSRSRINFAMKLDRSNVTVVLICAASSPATVFTFAIAVPRKSETTSSRRVAESRKIPRLRYTQQRTARDRASNDKFVRFPRRCERLPSTSANRFAEAGWYGTMTVMPGSSHAPHSYALGAYSARLSAFGALALIIAHEVITSFDPRSPVLVTACSDLAIFSRRFFLTVRSRSEK